MRTWRRLCGKRRSREDNTLSQVSKFSSDSSFHPLVEINPALSSWEHFVRAMYYFIKFSCRTLLVNYHWQESKIIFTSSSVIIVRWQRAACFLRRFVLFFFDKEFFLFLVGMLFLRSYKTLQLELWSIWLQIKVRYARSVQQHLQQNSKENVCAISVGATKWSTRWMLGLTQLDLLDLQKKKLIDILFLSQYIYRAGALQTCW